MLIMTTKPPPATPVTLLSPAPDVASTGRIVEPFFTPLGEPSPGDQRGAFRLDPPSDDLAPVVSPEAANATRISHYPGPVDLRFGLYTGRDAAGQFVRSVPAWVVIFHTEGESLCANCATSEMFIVEVHADDAPLTLLTSATLPTRPLP